MSRYPGQCRSKCYCQKPCSCYNISLAKSKKTKTSGPKFVKFKDESWNSRPCPEPQQPLNMKSFFGRLSTPDNTSVLSPLSSIHLQLSHIDCESENLTARRQYYEKLRDLLRDEKQTLVDLAQSARSSLDYIDDERIKRVNEFRLQNSDDCFSLLRQYSAERRLRESSITPTLDKEHVCEYRFRRNNRGLLEPAKDVNGKIVCEICGKTSENQISNTFTPVGTTGPQRIILEINETSDKRSKPPSMPRTKKFNKPLVPANSLALRFQQKY